MKHIVLLFLCAATLALDASAQNAPMPAAGTKSAGGAATGGTPPAAAKKSFPGGDIHTLLALADSLQFQLKMGEHITSKFHETDPALAAFGNPIRKETTDMWTPMVDMATAGGVEGKKIPLDMSKNDKANLAKLNTIKDEKKWTLAFFEFFAKEAKKNAKAAESGIKALTDPNLKAWAEKAGAMLNTQAEQIEGKFKEIKSAKK